MAELLLLLATVAGRALALHVLLPLLLLLALHRSLTLHRRLALRRSLTLTCGLRQRRGCCRATDRRGEQGGMHGGPDTAHVTILAS